VAFELLLVIGIYALGAAGVHWAHRRRGKAASPSRHYVLHVRDDGRRLEWVVRALLWHGLRRDRGIRITVIDDGSTDDTPALVHLMIRRFGIGAERAAGASPAGEPAGLEADGRGTEPEGRRLHAPEPDGQGMGARSMDPDGLETVRVRLCCPADWRRLPPACSWVM